jgi:hypothetical protein
MFLLQGSSYEQKTSEGYALEASAGRDMTSRALRQRRTIPQPGSTGRVDVRSRSAPQSGRDASAVDPMMMPLEISQPFRPHLDGAIDPQPAGLG